MGERVGVRTSVDAVVVSSVGMTIRSSAFSDGSGATAITGGSGWLYTYVIARSMASGPTTAKRGTDPSRRRSSSEKSTVEGSAIATRSSLQPASTPTAAFHWNGARTLISMFGIGYRAYISFLYASMVAADVSGNRFDPSAPYRMGTILTLSVLPEFCACSDSEPEGG